MPRTGSTQDRHNCREPRLDEIISDPIVVALMQADGVAPEALERLLRVVLSPFGLRSEARRLREMARTASDPDLAKKLAAQALDLAQRAEAIARWQEDPESLRAGIGLGRNSSNEQNCSRESECAPSSEGMPRQTQRDAPERKTDSKN